MNFTIQRVPDKDGHPYRIADEDDNAVAFCYDPANAQLLKAALDAYGMSATDAIRKFG